MLLALFEEQCANWAAAFEGKLERKLGDEEFCAALLETASERSIFIPLMLRLSAVIEHNVSIDALVASKRAMRERMDKLSSHVSTGLDFNEQQSSEVLLALAPLLVGAAQHDLAPKLEKEQLPSDVREFINAFATSTIFIPNACRIISGFRTGN